MNNNNILDISIYQIQLFLTVARERNFSKAAERLNLSQPTLSKRIAYMENMLGVSLFQRRERPIALTAEGEILFEHWERVLKDYEASIDAMLNKPGEPDCVLKVCLIDSSSPDITPVLTTGAQMEVEVPGFSFQWEYVGYPEFREKLHMGECDIAFVALMVANDLMEGLNWKLLNSFSKVACMLKTNPLAARESLTMDDLREQRFVVLSPSELPSHYQLVKHFCNAHNFDPKIARYAPNANALVSCLRANNEVIICDHYLRGVDYNHLKSFELPEIRSGLIAVWKKGNDNPWIGLYLEKLMENLPKLKRDIPVNY